MALRFLERELRRTLGVGGIALTDDGETVYVHLLPKEGWPGRAQGRAYVLAWEDYAPPGSERMYCYRWLVGEAKRSIGENGEKIVRWLEGK
jgi:hypothetical protein